jgi:hypothetical protein
VEEIGHLVVEKTFLKLLHVYIVEFLADFGIVNVNAIVVQFSQHITMLGDVRLARNLANFALFLLEVHHDEAKWPCTGLQLGHDVPLKHEAVSIK